MKLRWKILIGLATVLVIAVLAAVVHHFQLKAAVARYKAELKARSEPMELAQVVPPPVPPENNGTDIFLKGCSLFNTNKTVLSSNQPPMMRMVAPGRAMIGWQQPNVCEYSKSGFSTWLEIEAALELDTAGLEMLRRLPLPCRFDFKIDYAGGCSKIRMTPLTAVKKAAQRLSASAASSLQRGDTDMAAKDIEAIIAVANGASHDRMLISELVRMAVVNIAIAAEWELLQSTNITDAQLVRQQDAWTGLEFVQNYASALALERTVGQIDLEEMRTSSLQSYFGMLDNFGWTDRDDSFIAPIKIKYNTFMWRFWWSYPDELRHLQGIQALIESARAFQTNQTMLPAIVEAKSRIKKMNIAPDAGDSFWFTDPAKADFHSIISSSTAAFVEAFNKVMKVEAAKQLTATAIALKRFQLKHGTYPEKLSELTPEFLPSVPLDPVDGQPLRYRLDAGGAFTLYSIGENGVDNGGNPSLADQKKSQSFQWQNSNALDWVWPQPATAAEIQRYYEKHAKQP